MRGTNDGAPLPGTAAPTGGTLDLPGVDVITTAGDRIIDVVGYFDQKTFLEQLGRRVLVVPEALLCHLQVPRAGTDGEVGHRGPALRAHALSGGAPLPEALLQAWVDRGLMIIQGYGLTEALPGATMLRASDGLRKLGSAGTSCFFSDGQVVTPALEPVRPGEAAEVFVRGPNVTTGYWQQPGATSAAFEDGWLRTGDLAVVDDEGCLFISGRLKDMYISGGENVYPAEVEQALCTHPDVTECAVIGVPDEKWGEVGRAVVVLRQGRSLTPERLLAHLDGRLARYKCRGPWCSRTSSRTRPPAS